MADLILTPNWDGGIYRIETTDPVLGGEDGISNKSAKSLGNRTEWLKQKIDNILNNIASGSLIRQGVITGKHDANGLPAFGTYNSGAGTFKLNASPSEPFIASVSGGYNENGPVNYYAYFDQDVTISVPTGTRWIAVLIDGVSGAASILSMPRTGLVRSYVAPTSPSNNLLWYNLRSEKMYVYNSGTWNETLALVIGEYDSTAGAFIYANNIGIGERDLYGRNDIPAGTVSAFAGLSTPAGYLNCDGSAVSRAMYRQLFTAIGTTYGAGDGSTTFNLPDLRGEFIRGMDAGRGVDAGRVLGSAQTDLFKSHIHNLTPVMITNESPTSGSLTGVLNHTSGTSSPSYIESTGGSETRPRNVAMNYIIKF